MNRALHSFFLFNVVAATTVAFTCVAHAGRYEPIKGKGIEVCEAYKKNLESFQDSEPMACERKINPEFKDFSKPIWENVDLEQHRELFRRLSKYDGGLNRIYSNGVIDQWGKSVYDDDKELQLTIDAHKKMGYRFISRTRISSKEFGRDQLDVLRYRKDSCPHPSAYHSSNLYVLIEDPSVKDAMIHAAHPVEVKLRKEVSQNMGTDTTVDIFLYKNSMYIDKYCLSEQPGCTAKDTLIVFKYGTVRNPNSRSALDEYMTGFNTVCEYQYLSK